MGNIDISRIRDQYIDAKLNLSCRASIRVLTYDYQL